MKLLPELHEAGPWPDSLQWPRSSAPSPLRRVPVRPHLPPPPTCLSLLLSYPPFPAWVPNKLCGLWAQGSGGTLSLIPPIKVPLGAEKRNLISS